MLSLLAGRARGQGCCLQLPAAARGLRTTAMEGECGPPHEHELLEERAAAEKHHTPANVHVAVRAPAGPPAPAFDGSSGDGGGLLATDAASETHRDAMVIARSLSVAAMSPSPVKRSADLRQQNLLQDAALQFLHWVHTWSRCTRSIVHHMH